MDPHSRGTVTGLRTRQDKVTQCTGPTCTARVFFRLSQNNRRVILDADPSPDGNYVLDDGDRCHQISLFAPAEDGQARYHTHWTTCSDRDVFRQQYGKH